MEITTYKCDRCGRYIPPTSLLHLTIDKPFLYDGECKIIKNAVHMHVRICCFNEITKFSASNL